MADDGRAGQGGAEPLTLPAVDIAGQAGRNVDWRRAALLVARIVVPFALLVAVVHRFGAAAFRPALEVLAPLPIVGALVLGAVAITSQAARWRRLMDGVGLPLSTRMAVVECYRAAALNTVLPGGLAGDALRAWRHRTGAPGGWKPAAITVVADRAMGLCVLLATAAVVVIGQLSPAISALLAAGAVVAWLVSRPSLRRLSRSTQAVAWGWSFVVLAALLTMCVVVERVLDVPAGTGAFGVLAVAVLAGMAVPFNLGGWGPREAVGALAATLVGVPADVGIAVAAGYGLLSMVSVLPGFVALCFPRLAGLRAGSVPQVKLDADVLAEHEAA